MSLNKSLSRAIKNLSKARRDLENINDDLDGDWDTSLKVKRGVPMIAIHGPDCEVWSQEPFETVVLSFLSSDNLNEEAGPWLRKLEWAVKKIRQRVEFNRQSAIPPA